MKAVPTRKECLKILREAGCSEKVINHCLVVARLAKRVARLAGADRMLVEKGALLHDLGRARTHGIEHAVIGAQMARELDLPEEIVLMIERHIGAGVSANEAAVLGLPSKDYTPKTLEEKIVAHSDNLIDEDRKRPVSDVVAYLRGLGYEEVADRILALHRELSLICGVDLDDV